MAQGNCAGLAIERLRFNALPRRLAVPLSKALKRHAHNRVPSGGVVDIHWGNPWAKLSTRRGGPVKLKTSKQNPLDSHEQTK